MLTKHKLQETETALIQSKPEISRKSQQMAKNRGNSIRTSCLSNPITPRKKPENPKYEQQRRITVQSQFAKKNSTASEYQNTFHKTHDFFQIDFSEKSTENSNKFVSKKLADEFQKCFSEVDVLGSQRLDFNQYSLLLKKLNFVPSTSRSQQEQMNLWNDLKGNSNSYVDKDIMSKAIHQILLIPEAGKQIDVILSIAQV
jgi:hypothetical protein